MSDQGGGGVSQKVTKSDRGEGGCQPCLVRPKWRHFWTAPYARRCTLAEPHTEWKATVCVPACTIACVVSRLAFSVSCFQSSLFLVAEVTGFLCEIPWSFSSSEFCHILELASIESIDLLVCYDSRRCKQSIIPGKCILKKAMLSHNSLSRTIMYDNCLHPLWGSLWYYH